MMSKRAVKRIRIILVSSKVGRCARCMRLTLCGAVVGWLAFAATALFAPKLKLAVIVLPSSFTILWLTHIVTFGVRSMRAVRLIQPTRTDNVALDSRRHALLLLAQGMALATVTSAMMPRPAWAQSCDDGYHLCAGNPHGCCPNGRNYVCPYNECTEARNKCVTLRTQDDYYAYFRCCPTLYRC